MNVMYLLSTLNEKTGIGGIIDGFANSSPNSTASEIITAAFEFWNNIIKVMIDILGQSPKSFNSTSWNLLTTGTIGELFKGIGCGLIPLFFLMNLCKQNIDVKQEMRFEIVLKVLVKLCFCEFLVMNCFTILEKFIESIGLLVKGVGNLGSMDLTVSSGLLKQVKGLGTLSSFFFVIIAFIFFVITLVLGCMMIYTVSFRLIKVIAMTPFCAIAVSTYAGEEGLSQTSKAYLKNYLAVLGEAVFMMVALIICSALFKSTTPIFDFGKLLSDSTNKFISCTVLLVNNLLYMSITVGVVKAAQQSVEKMFAL